MSVMDGIDKIKRALNIERVVCVKYSDEDMEGAKDYRVCDGMLAASEGKIIKLTAESCACEGGKNHLGLSDINVPLKFLVEGEKLWRNVTIAYRSMQGARKIAMPPHDLAKNVYLYPPEKAVFEPDLVLFIADPAQASRLVTLDQFWDGSVVPLCMNGSLCWSSITYPLMSGHINVTVGDPSARRLARFKNEELIVSVPFERIKNISKAIDLSTAGTAEPSETWVKTHENE